MTANNSMTGEQLDELMTVAVNMQRDSEKSGDRPTAMFAYAVQVAVLELRKVRNDAAALAEDNAGLIERLKTWESGCEPCWDTETPATDAFLAEVRAQGVEMFGQWLRDSADIFDKNSRHDWAAQNRVSADKAGEFAEHLRKGDQS